MAESLRASTFCVFSTAGCAMCDPGMIWFLCTPHQFLRATATGNQYLYTYLYIYCAGGILCYSSFYDEPVVANSMFTFVSFAESLPGACGRYVQETAPDCAWLVLSPALRGRLHALDSADDVTRLAAFGGRFSVGQSLRCRVVQVLYPAPFSALFLLSDP